MSMDKNLNLVGGLEAVGTVEQVDQKVTGALAQPTLYMGEGTRSSH
jgi:hypothetical protein